MESTVCHLVMWSFSTLTRAWSMVLAQAIHHATEHRARIAGALVAHEVLALNLDDFVVWAFGDADGLGE